VTTIHLLFIVVFFVLSIADLRYRVLPGIQVVFWGAVLISVPDSPLMSLAVVLAVGWGWLNACPNAVMLPLLLYPASWPVLLTGTGVRRGIIGRGDLLAAGSLALIFPWQALITAFVSVEVWRRWWAKRYQSEYVPALPGMLLGICVYAAAGVFGVV